MVSQHRHAGLGICLLSLAIPLLSQQTTQAQVIKPVLISSLSSGEPRKPEAVEGGFTGLLEGDDGFGSSIVNLGDLDGDGLNEIAVGAPGDDDGHGKHGAVWILFLNDDGTVRKHQKLSASEGGFTAATDDEVEFGSSAAELGDLDGDGVPDLAVQSASHVYTLLLDSLGNVKSQNSNVVPSPCGSCPLRAIANIGDFDMDGIDDLGGSAYLVSGLTGSRNELFVWPMDSSGSLTPHQVTNREHGLGDSFSGFGDFDGNGFPDLIDGHSGDRVEGVRTGSVDMVLLKQGTVSSPSYLKEVLPINISVGELSELKEGDQFGGAVAPLGDFDGNGVPDIIVGAPGDDDGGFRSGAIWIVYLNEDGSVRVAQKISAAESSFLVESGPNDNLGSAIASIGDLNGDGDTDLAVGAPGYDGGAGAVWILFSIKAFEAAIGIEPIGEQTASMGEALSISTSISAPDEVLAEGFFRQSGNPGFIRREMTEEAGGTFTLTIPGSQVTARGLEYYVTATNTSEIRSREPEIGFISVPVAIPEGLAKPAPHGDDASSYRLISFPIDLDQNSARTLLEPTLGPYDDRQWRFFVQGRSDLRDLGQQPGLKLTLGEAYWLLVKDPNKTINTGAGYSVRTDTTFQKVLQPGWTLVGNPYAFPIPPSNLSTLSGQPLDIRAFLGSWSVHDGALEPFEGYAVFNAHTEPDSLLINPDLTPVFEKNATSRAGKTVSPTWSIHIDGYLRGARDTDNTAAVGETAARDWDRQDRPEPPVVGDYLSIYFPHPEWDRAAARYNVDARPVPSDGEIWSFEIDTRLPERVELRFTPAALPENFGAWLIDDDLGISVDVLETPRYTTVGMGSGHQKRLRLIVGTPQFASDEIERLNSEKPTTTNLLQNFPNPFSGATTIMYTLAQASGVTLQVYDVIGRKVATLVDGEQEAGNHAVVWDGLNDLGVNMATGAYFYRLNTDRGRQTARMVLTANSTIDGR